MQTFQSADDMYFMVLMQLIEHGQTWPSRDGNMREMLCVQVALANADFNFVLHQGRNLSPVYASAEVLWYLSRSDRVDMIAHYAPSYRKYAEDDGHDWAAYGHRIATNLVLQDNENGPFAVDQLEVAVGLLRNDPMSRRCVVTLWAPYDLYNAAEKLRKSVPCTVMWQFFRRGEFLHMETYMRSNDAWKGLPYDVYAFTTIQRMVAAELGCVPGFYTHSVGSMHLYERDVEKARKMLQKGPYKPVHIDLVGGKLRPEDFALRHDYPADSNFRGLEWCLQAEEHARTTGKTLKPYPEYEDVSDVVRDAYFICASHCVKDENNDGAIHSNVLKKAYADFRARKKEKL